MEIDTSELAKHIKDIETVISLSLVSTYIHKSLNTHIILDILRYNLGVDTICHSLPDIIEEYDRNSYTRRSKLFLQPDNLLNIAAAIGDENGINIALSKCANITKVTVRYAAEHNQVSIVSRLYAQVTDGRIHAAYGYAYYGNYEELMRMVDHNIFIVNIWDNIVDILIEASNIEILDKIIAKKRYRPIYIFGRSLDLNKHNVCMHICNKYIIDFEVPAYISLNHLTFDINIKEKSSNLTQEYLDDMMLSTISYDGPDLNECVKLLRLKGACLHISLIHSLIGTNNICLLKELLSLSTKKYIIDLVPHDDVKINIKTLPILNKYGVILNCDCFFPFGYEDLKSEDIEMISNVLPDFLETALFIIEKNIIRKNDVESLKLLHFSYKRILDLCLYAAQMGKRYSLIYLLDLLTSVNPILICSQDDIDNIHSDLLCLLSSKFDIIIDSDISS